MHKAVKDVIKMTTKLECNFMHKNQDELLLSVGGCMLKLQERPDQGADRRYLVVVICLIVKTYNKIFVIDIYLFQKTRIQIFINQLI